MGSEDNKKVHGFYVPYKLPTLRINFLVEADKYRRDDLCIELPPFESVLHNQKIVWTLSLTRPSIRIQHGMQRSGKELMDYVYFTICAKSEEKLNIFYQAILGDEHKKSVLLSQSTFGTTSARILEKVKIDSLKTFVCDFGEVYLHIYLIDNSISVDNLITARSRMIVEERDFLKTCCDLSDNISNLYNSELLSDAVIIAKDKEFKVHKAIFAARSNYFAALFKHDLLEKKTNRVDMKNEFGQLISSNIAENFINYIYTGLVENLEQFAVEIYALAHMYEIPALQTECIAYLKSIIDINNATTLLLLAKKYEIKELYMAVTSFFKMHAKEIFDDNQDKMTTFGTRCSLILDQFFLRNKPYETPSQMFHTKSLSGVENKFIAKVYKEFSNYQLQIDIVGDCDDENLREFEFFYMICDKIGKNVDYSVYSHNIVKPCQVSSKCSIDLMSETKFKDWTFAHETPLVLVLYLLNHSPVSGKLDVLATVKNNSLQSGHSSTKCQLSNDLSILYEKGDLTDFKIVTENKIFNVHKCVLAARSSVFTKHFENNETDDSITINIKTEVVEEMLRFMYTDSVTTVENLVDDLYKVANEYNLRGLKEKCVSHMSKGVSVDNAMRLLHFAKKHNEKSLLSKVTEFFMKNTEQILDSKTTDEFLKPLLNLHLSLSSSGSSN